MGKALKSWSGMRKYLEQEMLADSLKGRVRYSLTTFVGMDGCGVFEICVDGKTIKRFSMETVSSRLYREKHITDMRKAWAEFWELKDSVPLNSRDEFDDEEFAQALVIYRSKDILQAIDDENPIVRMFAVLDRRIGIRTLEKLKDTLARQPQWLRFFYRLRMEAEGIACPET